MALTTSLTPSAVYRISQVYAFEDFYLHDTAVNTAATTFASATSQTTTDLYTLQTSVNRFLNATVDQPTIYTSGVRFLLSVENEITSCHLDYLSSMIGSNDLTSAAILGTVPAAPLSIESILAAVIRAVGDDKVAPTTAVTVKSCTYTKKDGYELNTTLYTTSNNLAHAENIVQNCAVWAGYKRDHYLTPTGIVGDCTPLISSELSFAKCVSYSHT